jgi:hypothetical protein
MSPIVWTRPLAVSSKPVFLLPGLERRFAAFHDFLYRIANERNVDRSFAGDLAARLVARLAVVTPDDKFCVAIHHQVRVVAGKNDLPLLLRRAARRSRK